MLELYHNDTSTCAQKARLTLAEKGLEWKSHHLDLRAGDQQKPEYLKLNPRGRVPTLVVDGHILTENVGIMTYVAGGHPKANLWPRDTWHQAQAVSTMAWLSNTVHTTFGHVVRPARYADDPAAQEAIKAKARTMYEEQLREIDRLLAGKKWSFDNRFTVVDGYLLVFYRWGNRQKMPVRSLANYSALMDRVLARPAVKKVMADEGITLD